MVDGASPPVTLKAQGRKVDSPSLPRALRQHKRSADEAQTDVFLPAGYVRPVAALDLTPAARSTPEGRVERALPATRDQVLCIELSDGLSVFTSPDKLEETLRRIAPEAVHGSELEIEALARRAHVVSRSAATSAASVIARVTTLEVGGIPDAILELAHAELKRRLKNAFQGYSEIGVSWLGTKVLLWAVESQLAQPPGLYRWVSPTTSGASGASEQSADLAPVSAARLASDAQQGPLLLFIHGTGSSTAGSYSELRTASREYWHSFEASYGERVFAFEHRTMSESPIENALALVNALPQGARLHLVTHSRGGLIGDLLSLNELHAQDAALVQGYGLDAKGKLDPLALGEVEGSERERVAIELAQAYAEQREALRQLAQALALKQIKVERYVRVGCPARGTRLASGNLDVFLSALLSLIGLVPALAGNPIYAAFKRIVLEIVKNRTKPNLVPGIEAMLPESPLARLLSRAQVQQDMHMAVIAGDIEGDGLFKRIGVLFTDHVFFGGGNNDLIVDTDSMYAGIAPRVAARALFDQGPDVSHFRYFVNAETRTALRRWLQELQPSRVEAFSALPQVSAERPVRRDALLARSGARKDLPVVVVLPGIMGSHLWHQAKDRIWFDFASLALGGLAKVRYDQPDIEAEALFGMFYGELCEHLTRSHRVEPFAYDWRLSLERLADALRPRLEALLAEEPARPVRILAHSMGGLVVRALIHKYPELWNRLMARPGARFVMLGTPNHGSHALVETLIGKSDLIRMLGRLDLDHDLGAVLDIVASFRGALALLPRPGFQDSGRAQFPDYFDAALWPTLKQGMRDFWFGDGVAATPAPSALQEARWLWDQLDTLPAQHEASTYYVFGCARATPAGLKQVDGRFKLVASARGDGSVTWDSGRISGISPRNYFWMPADHGALADTPHYFDSLDSLLSRGEPGLLLKHEPLQRDAATSLADVAGQPADALTYDAGPPVVANELDLAAGVIGRQKPRILARARRLPTLNVSVRAADLRYTSMPILVGHYERDAISGAEAVIDRELVFGALTLRYDLGTYAGPLGTATVVLPARNELERGRGSLRGAVVAGLGKYDGSLSIASLTEAVRTAALRYLLQSFELSEGKLGDVPTGIPLASLLLGYDSSANLSVDDAMLALVRGVAEANRKFAETTRGAPLYIAELEVVELYTDTAISAAYALRRVQAQLNQDASLRCCIEISQELHQGEGKRARLEDRHRASHWSRAVITSDASEAELAAGAPAVAKRLRFLYLSQRARAETVVQQRQPGLVENLVAQQLHITSYREDFSRALFQLLIPHEFKDAVRQLTRAVLVLDAYTANLPWELMLADDKPLCVKAPLVRQLSTTAFRTQVKQSPERRAYVIGNPATAGFAAAFALRDELSALPAAESEAYAVADVLSQYHYEVLQSIGADQTALDVVNRLYQHPYRLLHIAAHGVFEQRHQDGQLRSGVVLSDGLLIGAAEIGAMEVVPDLVFLNCCHLGKVDAAPSALNRLAYSVARELIEVGVRAVVVAGWAVDDEPANLFADTFYRALLGDRASFGDAAFAARQRVWERYPSSITWGAYQVYGDPSFRLEQPSEEYANPTDTTPFSPVAPEELCARLERQRTLLSRETGAEGGPALARHARIVDELLAAAPQVWLERADVCAAAGSFFGDLGVPYFDRAEPFLLKAIAQGDTGRAPVQAIEQLANFESRAGQVGGDQAKVQRAVARLLDLVRATAPDPEQAHDPTFASSHRAGLLGGAFKRLAAVHAARYLAAQSETERARHARGLDEALSQSTRWYRGSIADLDAPSPDPYTGLNWLFLATLAPHGEDTARSIAFAQRCAQRANARYADNANFWDAIMAADACLVESILDGSLRAQATSDARLRELEAKYRAAQVGIVVKQRDIDSVLSQFELMALFFAARARRTDGEDEELLRLAAALKRLARTPTSTPPEAELEPDTEPLSISA